ncbi:hypothetical protein PR048_030438 [Dryococelus australis]|uniref:Uncharacterized protein n=1 Tax=Dryococelus australis TaxID=614101 RepID=A0ABQ9G8Z8_9NEOP|nr:hypothetical protein PR048_030438 [Dryococelus australis]
MHVSPAGRDNGLLVSSGTNDCHWHSCGVLTSATKALENTACKVSRMRDTTDIRYCSPRVRGDLHETECGHVYGQILLSLRLPRAATRGGVARQTRLPSPFPSRPNPGLTDTLRVGAGGCDDVLNISAPCSSSVERAETRHVIKHRFDGAVGFLLRSAFRKPYHFALYYNVGATVTERLACSPPTKASRVQSPAGSLRIMEMDIAPEDAAGRAVSPALSFRRCIVLTSFHPHRLSRSRRRDTEVYVSVTYAIGTPLIRNALQGSARTRHRQRPEKIREFNDLHANLYSLMCKYADVYCTLVFYCHSGRRQLDTVLNEVSNTAWTRNPGRGNPLRVTGFPAGTRMFPGHDMKGDPRMDRRWNARARETGVSRENPPTSGIVNHDFHMRKSGSEPGRDRAQITVVGGERPSHCATAAPF